MSYVYYLKKGIGLYIRLLEGFYNEKKKKEKRDKTFSLPEQANATGSYLNLNLNLTP